MRENPSPFLFTCFLIAIAFSAVPCSAAYSQTFDPSASVVVNQSLVHDPTGGASAPWALWVMSGIAGLLLSIFSLTRAKTQRMDYEVNIILSVIAWPFFAYFAWGGMTTVDYVVGLGAATTSTGGIAMITQHILYSFWLLGWIGIAGTLAAIFITALLISQYGLFKENEVTAAAERIAAERGV